MEVPEEWAAVAYTIRAFAPTPWSTCSPLTIVAGGFQIERTTVRRSFCQDGSSTMARRVAMSGVHAAPRLQATENARLRLPEPGRGLRRTRSQGREIRSREHAYGRGVLAEGVRQSGEALPRRVRGSMLAGWLGCYRGNAMQPTDDPEIGRPATNRFAPLASFSQNPSAGNNFDNRGR